MTVLLCLTAIIGTFLSPETGSQIFSETPISIGYTNTQTPVELGTGEWTGQGPWGGNLRGLATSFSDNNIVIAGCGFSMASDAGGAWRSTNGGVNWEVTDLPATQVNDVCSGGQAAPNSFYASTKTGLYSSSDNGITWEKISSGYFLAVGINSADPNLLIGGLSSNSGIKRSTDGGVSWETVGLTTGFMKGFGCDPDHPDTMYVAMSGISNALYRTVDGGASWSAIGPTGSGWGLLVAPFGSAATIILSTSDGFYMSTDYGVSWDLVVTGASYAPAVCDGVNLYAPVISASGVYESTDQGASWNLNTSGIVASYWQAGCSSSAGYLAGHNGGIYRTSTPSAEYVVSQQGISNSYIHALSYTASTNTLLAGGEWHGLWKSTDSGLTWDIITPGPGNWTIYDIAPKTENIYTGAVRYIATSDGVYRSNDSGENWISAGLTGTSISSVAFNPTNPDMAWAGTSISGVQYTTDGGATWALGAGSASGFYPAIELITLASGETRVLVTFQQNSQGVYYSDDYGVSYTLSPVPGDYLPDLSISPHVGETPTAFLATSAGVYKSIDYGESWTACPGSSGLLWTVQGSLSDNVFAGTNGTGIKWSPDDGDSWQPLNTGIENRVVWDITLGDSEEQLFAGLRGFGVVELTDSQLGIVSKYHPNQPLTLTISPNPVISSVNFNITGSLQNAGQILIYSADGRLIHEEDFISINDVNWSPDSEISSGIYLVKVKSGNLTASSRMIIL